MLNKTKIMLVCVLLGGTLHCTKQKKQEPTHGRRIIYRSLNPSRTSRSVNPSRTSRSPLPSTGVANPEKVTIKPSALEVLDKEIDNGMHWINKNRWETLGLALVGSVIFYNLFKESISKKTDQFRNFWENKIIDALIKFEEIKEDGFTKQDYMKGIATLVAVGSAGGAVYYYGINETKNYAGKIFNALKTHKIYFGAGLLGIELSRWLYEQKIAYDERTSHVLNFNQFLGKLTEEQRRTILNSGELLVAIATGGDNHRRLLQNKEFMKLLTDAQKTYLQTIVNYRCSGVRE